MADFLLLITTDKVDVFVCASPASDMTSISYISIEIFFFFFSFAMNTMPVAHIEYCQ